MSTPSVAPYKAERSDSYTCGNCMRVFHVKHSGGRRPQSHQKCQDCGRVYSFSPLFSYTIEKSPYEIKP
jgi:transposase-like protein